MLVEPYFQELGFNQKEIEVYLCLARLGKSSATVLAKSCQMPRSTVYSVLDQLYQRGLVSLEQKKGITLFIPNPPSSIQRMVESDKEEQIKEIEKKEQVASELVEVISPLFKSENFSVPKLQFFEGKANVTSMLYDYCREWQKNITHSDRIWWGYQDNSFVEEYREWLEYYWASMIEGEEVRLFSNKSEIEKELKDQVKGRTIKLVPKGFHISSTIWVLGEYVITIMTRQKPHYAFQLKDAVFAANQRQIFQLLWQSRK